MPRTERETNDSIPNIFYEAFEDAPSWVLNPDLPRGNDWDPLKEKTFYESFREKISSWSSVSRSFVKSSWELKGHMVGGAVGGTSTALWTCLSLNLLSRIGEGFFQQQPFSPDAIKAITEASFVNGFSWGVLIKDWLDTKREKAPNFSRENKLSPFI